MDIVAKYNNVVLDEASNINPAQERKYCDFCCDNFIPFVAHTMTDGKNYVEVGSLLRFRKVVFQAKVSYVQ